MGDVFNAFLDDASGSLQGILGIQTLGGQDIITGTDEVDVLNAELNATGTTQNPTITDVEIYNLTVMPLPAIGAILPSFGVLDLHRSEGYEQLWNIDSRYSLEVINVKTDDAGDAPIIGMDGVRGGTTYTVAYDAGQSVGEQDVIATNVGGPGALGQANLSVEVDNGIGTLNLDVSNGVQLNLVDDAAGMAIFNITGSGLTTLSAVDPLSSNNLFVNLEELDSTGYTGDLTLDVSGSDVLTSVATNGGDDFITVNTAAVNGDLAVDLAGGDDTLALGGPIAASAAIDGLDFTGGMTSVETLAFDRVKLTSPDDSATLNLDGFDGALSTISANYFDVAGTFALRNAPEELNIDVVNDFEVGDFASGSGLDTGNVTDLTVTVEGSKSASADTDDIDIGNLTGSNLESLALVNEASDENDPSFVGNINLAIISGKDQFTDVDGNLVDGDVSALKSISADATGAATVTLDASDADADMDALKDVNVTAEGDATLKMDGYGGVLGIPGTQQTQEFTIDVASSVGFAAGDLVFDHPDFPGGSITIPYSAAAWQPTDEKVAADVTAALNAVAGISATRGFNSDVVTVTWDAVGEFDPITFDASASSATVGSINNGAQQTDFTQGAPDVGGVPASGFEGMEAIVVDAGELATVDLTDVYGTFTLDVTAEGTEGNADGLVNVETTADVTLIDTGVTEATIRGGDEFTYTYDNNGDADGLDDIDLTVVSVSGDNSDLTSMTIEGAAANVSLADELSSFTTLDLTGVNNVFYVDAKGANFAPDAGDYVSYLIGGTASELGGSTIPGGGDSQINMNAARETVTFTEGDFGTVVLNDFMAGDDPTAGDRIDLSELGFTNNGQLAFEIGSYDDGTGVWTAADVNNLTAQDTDVRITDLAGGPEMSGEIIVTGEQLTPSGTSTTVGSELSDDLSQYNMTYA